MWFSRKRHKKAMQKKIKMDMCKSMTKIMSNEKLMKKNASHVSLEEKVKRDLIK